jgi:tetratricopeptide (TPR) repeat protein
VIRRGLALAGLIAVLAGIALGARARLEAAGGERVPPSLLYLPKGPFLRALALGQEESLADLLYIWSIQYYSNYEDATRYDYLDQVFAGAITELDPRYVEPYLIGSLIMSMEAKDPRRALRLFDKGLERNPDNWELAYWAGWECYGLKDYACARDYWARASRMPQAPPQLMRLAAKMLEREGDVGAALREYRAILDSTTDEGTRQVVAQWYERTRVQFELQQAGQAVEAWRAARGSCPPSLAALVEAGLLGAVPVDAAGNPFHLDRAACTVLPAPGQSFQRQP